MSPSPPSVAERASRLFEKHPQLLASPRSCRRIADHLAAAGAAAASSTSSRGRRLRRVLGFALRLLLLWAFCSVALHCLESTLPRIAHSLRVGRALSYLNLLHLKSYRWLTVQAGLYRSELLQSRDRDACLLPNPLYRAPLMCCACQQLPARLPSVRLGATPAGRDAFRRVVDSHVTPFLVPDSGHAPVTYRELRQAALDAWPEVSAGSNRIHVHNRRVTQQAAPSSLSELLANYPDRPPNASLTVWTFGHMSAIRAMRRLVPRPAFVRPDVGVGFARAFYLFAGSSDEASVELGDLAQFQGIALMMGLHGTVRIELAAKAACCPKANAASVVVLSPGQTLVVPCQCYELRAARLENSDREGYAMLHLFSVFSSTGIKQPAPITGRVPERDEVADDY